MLPHHLPLSRRLLLASLLLLPACDSGTAEGHDRQHLTVTGSSTVAPLAAEIARRFEEQNPGVVIDVQSGGSSKGISDARRGLADVGMASRALKSSELGEVMSHTIAVDGVGLIVHSSNSVAELSDDQVRAIYRGEISNWNEVGGVDAEITVVTKASGRATLEVFLAHFGMTEEEIHADVVIGDNQQGIKTVQGNPHALGYVSIGAAEYEVGRGTPLRLLPAGGVTADSANVASGQFPISRPLNFITRGEVDDLAQRFLDFARSSEVHDLVTDLFFVPAAAGE